jgi:hypothetical protein
VASFTIIEQTGRSLRVARAWRDTHLSVTHKRRKPDLPFIAKPDPLFMFSTLKHERALAYRKNSRSNNA